MQAKRTNALKMEVSMLEKLACMQNKLQKTVNKNRIIQHYILPYIN